MIEWQLNETITYGVIGVGWLVAVICILRRQLLEKGKYSCLVGDIISATFTTITLGLVITLFFAVYIDLRNSQSSNQSLKDQVMFKDRTIDDLTQKVTHLSKLTANQEANYKSLSSEKIRLTKQLENDKTIVEDLMNLWKKGKLTEDGSALQSVHRHFGENVEIVYLRFSFPTGSDATIECIYERNFKCIF